MTGLTYMAEVGDVILFRSKLTWSPMSWVSVPIRFLTGSPFNHAGIVGEDNEVFLYEATEDGIVRTPLQERLAGRDWVVLRPKFDFYKPFVNQRINYFYQAKTKYDFASLFVFQLIFQLTGLWIGRKKLKADDRLYCTEYVGYVYSWQHDKPWLLDPNALYTHDKYEHIFYQTL